jgi:cytochrome c oxidase subunit 3
LSAKTHAALAHHFDDLAQQHRAATLGMWTFLVTEVMLFGGVVTGYAVYRSAYAAEFAGASGHLSIVLGGVNTAILLGSSLTMALAVRSAQLGSSRGAAARIGLTLVLGTVFLAIKASEWYAEYRDGLIPGRTFHGQEFEEAGLDPATVQLFFVFYFVLTGLHAAHMLIGMGVLSLVGWWAWRNRYDAEYHTPVEAAGLYWHFVDVVWIYLFPLLYLIGTRHV